MTPLVITGAGAITSVGRGVAASCAAIHAGIARPRRVNALHIVEPETQELIGIQSHPVHGYTEGFSLLGRWMRLARGSVQDLMSLDLTSAGAGPRFWESTGLMLVVGELDDQTLLTEEGQVMTRLQDEFLEPLVSALGFSIPSSNIRLFTQGHAGTALALQAGLRRLAAREMERLLLIAVDSYIDGLRLEGLVEKGRLKTEEQSVGFSPGEAGVALLFETEPGARRRNTRALGQVLAVATDQEPAQLPRIQRGRALTRCTQRLLDETAPSASFRGDLYNDLNGETWRAQEWGHVRVNLSQRMDLSQWHLPCNSVGDVGAASGALGICLALHSRASFQGSEPHSLVLSSSDSGDVGGIVLRTPGEGQT